MKLDKLVAKATEILESGAPIVTGAEIRSGVVERVQLYFRSEKETVMDVISKDDLVQNFPDEGVYVLSVDRDGGNAGFRKLVMFEGKEDMYFRTDGTHEEADEFADVPAVGFMEAVEALCAVRFK